MAIPPVLGPLAKGIAAKTADVALSKLGNTLLSSLANAVKNGTEITSLADIARPARVEPLVLVDQVLANQPYMESVMKFSLTTFSGYYLQAVSMIMNVGRIDTLKVFDSLNPNRSIGDLNVKDAIWSQETWNNGLPSLEAFTQPVERGLIAVALEAAEFGGAVMENAKGAPPTPNAPAAPRQSMSVADDSKRIYEIENLAVGKLLNVELRDGDQSKKIPVLIRLLPTKIPSNSLTHMFTAGGADTWGDRWHLVRAGQIRFVRDFIFQIDMLDEHFKALINDKSGTYAAITDRRKNNVKKAALTGSVSLADASNIAVVSSETAKQMASKLYGKLDNMAVRQKIFDNSYLLLLVVVDERWERVTVYHRGLDFATEYSFKEIQNNEKGKGPDITEIFKMFHQSMGSNI